MWRRITQLFPSQNKKTKIQGLHRFFYLFRHPDRTIRFGTYLTFFGFLLLILVLVTFYQNSNQAEAAWWHDGWTYRQKIVIGNSGSAIAEERKVKIDLDTASLISAGKLQSSCNDIRFTNHRGVQLDYFIDTYTADCNNASTDFYVKLPEVIAGNQVIYVYYGNASALNISKSYLFSNDPLSEGLTGYWKLDETTANTCSNGINDACDLALTNDGLWSADATYTALGILDGAVTFDGVGDNINLSNDSSFSLPTATSEISISAWIKTAATNAAIVGMRGSSSTVFDFQLGFDGVDNSGTGKPSFIVRDDSGGGLAHIHGSVAINNNEWHHVVVTRNSAKSLKIYVDNATAASGSDTMGTSVTFSNVLIGDEPLNSSMTNMNGLIDDVRIYKKALTTTEISVLYNNGLGSAIDIIKTFIPNSGPSAASEEVSPGPVAYWKLDEGQGQIANDSSVQGNSGQLGATSGSESSDPTWRSEEMCISGKCLEFDGTDDWIDVGSDPASVKTVSFWVRPITASEHLIDLNGSAYIKTTSGTLSAEGFTDATIYVNGQQSTAVVANLWQYITVITNTAVNSSDMDIGRLEGTDYFQGFIDEVKIYPYARSVEEIKADFMRGAAGAGSQVNFGTQSTAFLNHGLIGYWPMDEVSADSCSDSKDTCDYSGNNSNGTWGDTATGIGITGKYGGGTTFDGLDTDNISFSGTNLAMGIGDMTISTWYKTNDTNGVLVEKSQVNNDSTAIYLSSGAAQAYLKDWDVTQISVVDPSTTNDDAWHHAVVVFDRDKLMTLYVDGEDVGSTNMSMFDGTDIATGTFKIGNSQYNNSPYGGEMDETRVYNRALSSDEVRALYEWAPGPIGHWKMDDGVQGDGQTLIDSSGNVNNGTTNDGTNNTGMDCTVQGKYGKGCRFDGTDDKVTIANSDELQPQQLTISAWIKSVGNTWNHHIISKCSSDGSCTTGYLIQLMRGNYYSFARGLTGGAVGLGAPSGDWEHIAIVYDGTKAIGYKNGVVINSSNYTGTITHSNQDLILGGWTAGIQYWGGYLDEVKIYNYARTQKQIVEDMNAGAPAVGGAVGSPVGHWKFDEGYGDVAHDSSPLGNDGDLYGTCPGAATCPTWVNEGKIGKALSFDGGDYVHLGDVAALKPLGGMTISAWFNTSMDCNDTWNMCAIYRYRMNGFFLGLNNSEQLDFFIFNSTPTEYHATSTATYNDGQWHQAFGVYDGSLVKLYVDGQLVNSNAAGILYYGSGYATIGRSASDATGYWNGLIDEVKLYNYALTDDEVKIEYNQGIAQVLGSTSTEDDGTTPSWGSARDYCIPGDTATCDAPVAEWKMDENVSGHGQTINDTSGNGNTGTSVDGANNSGMNCAVQGKVGGGCEFDGDDTINVGNSTLLSSTPSNQWTMAAWVIPTGSSGNKNIIRKNDSGLGYFLRRSGDDIQFSMNAVEGRFYHSVTSFDLNKWQFVAAVYDGSKSYLYKNGRLLGTWTENKTLSFNTDNVFIGSNNGGSEFWTGNIDQARIYDYARTPAQIAWEYNQGAPITHYRLDECQGTTAHDSSGKDYHGTITIGSGGGNSSAGTCSSGTSTEAWNNGTTGKFAASLDFDGSDDYVKVNDPSDGAFDFGIGNFTISTWINRNTSNTTDAILGKRGTTAHGNFYVMACESSSGTLTLELDEDAVGTNYQAFQTAGICTTGSWINVAVVRTDDQLLLFKNGVQMAETSSLDTNLSNAYGLMIGARGINAEAPYAYFDGQIDDVKIWNYALTAEQLKLEYNNGAVRFD